MRNWLAGSALVFTAVSGAAQQTLDLPVVDLSGPVVIALWADPPEGRVDTDGDLASLYDDFMYYWAESADPLEAMGVGTLGAPVPWDDRRAILRRRNACWSARITIEVGYVIADAEGAPRLIDHPLFDEDLLEAVRTRQGSALDAVPCPG